MSLRRVYKAECIPVKKSLKACMGHFSDMRRRPTGGKKEMVECFYRARERGGKGIRGESWSVSHGEMAFLEHVCSWGEAASISAAFATQRGQTGGVL